MQIIKILWLLVSDIFRPILSRLAQTKVSHLASPSDTNFNEIIRTHLLLLILLHYVTKRQTPPAPLMILLVAISGIHTKCISFCQKGAIAAPAESVNQQGSKHHYL